ncbi:hypothetical protein [Streptomyces ardesiacus]|uniref:hypothetical protein n=1 Tax=Streptomyces ardesiacus TaxID=285564 RepID=UPI00201EB180|nr:hypothetical protein [Streptomyces ardesiacus]MCL7370015.1 hypothetical protein [Streptomyces ardesiacus]
MAKTRGCAATRSGCGELAALRHRAFGLEGLTVTVRRAQAELQDDRLCGKAPRSAARVRAVDFPAELLDAVTHLLEQVTTARSTNSR